LTNEFHAISTKMYEQAAAANGGAAPGGEGFDPNMGDMGGTTAEDQSGVKHDNVVDADYEVVDEDEKK
ncbi:MAG: hypothetical protein RR131_09565, partial [Anaerovorax sp.]